MAARWGAPGGMGARVTSRSQFFYLLSEVRGSLSTSGLAFVDPHPPLRGPGAQPKPQFPLRENGRGGRPEKQGTQAALRHCGLQLWGTGRGRVSAQHEPSRSGSEAPAFVQEPRGAERAQSEGAGEGWVGRRKRPLVGVESCARGSAVSSSTSCPLPVNLSSWDTMDPCPPRAPPSPERCPGSPSLAPLAPQPPPRVGCHLLIDGNGVPYMYTVPLDEELPPKELEAPQGEAAGGMEAPTQGYRCPECFQVFKSPLYLKRHGISHSDLRPYVCGVCAKTFKRSSSLCQHRLTHHTRGSRAHPCPLCPRRFLDAQELAHHIRGH
ncbi:uncharacterized protein [Notamacropus eugenii]|uniref:uncharacterized protein n=1 Tax=Notamacropus eugenii TaxID=9315 RepID=UPI003B683DFD